MPYIPLLPSSNSIQVYKNVDLTEDLTQKLRDRLFCGYSSNTNQTTTDINVWARFPYPSSGYQTYRNNNFSINESMSRFTYLGDSPKWFDINATCNVFKGTGANIARTIEFQWFVNNIGVGPVRQFQMTIDSDIITGNGEIYLSPNDYLEPHIRNVENGDKALLTNCSFNIREDYDYVWRV